MAEQSGKHVVLPVLFVLGLLPLLQGCAPESTEEDHPYYLNYRDTKQALARVVEARPDDLFVFPTDAPEGVNDMTSYTNNEHLKQMFYVYQGVRVESCIAVSPEECSERGEGESEYLIASGVDGDKKWRVFATATTGGLVATELGGRSSAADVPSPPEEWGSMDSPPQVPQPSESVDRVLELWAGYTFTTESEPAWITEYAQDPPVCEPECY